MHVHRFRHAEFDLLKWIILLSLASAFVLFLTRPTSAWVARSNSWPDVAERHVDVRPPLDTRPSRVARRNVALLCCFAQEDCVR